MKKLVLTLTLAIAALLSFAQIPQTFSYQAVVRDAENKLVVSKPIVMELSILQGSDEGEVVYTEKHVVSTNSNGLISLEMGAGVSRDDFSAIDWSNAPYFVKTVAEIDGKTITGITPLLAVPYALYAAKAGNAEVDLSAYATKEDIPSTDGFATKEELNALNIPSVEGLASESYVNEKVAAIEIPSMEDFATKEELNALNIPSVEGLASESYVNEKVAAIEIPSMEDFATKEELNALNISSVEGLASESYVDEKVESIDLSDYYLKADVDALLSELNAKIKELDKQMNPPVFSVSETKKVSFSQGNLQYQASTGTWRFAEHQYDMIGADNTNISEDYDGWIDMFGWGTSGWNNGANAYQPYSTSTDYRDYYPGNNYNNNLIDAYANADWGVYNKISNGGNQAGMWRTLTQAEWDYLINARTNAASKYGVARVNGVNGLIILPDNWSLPAGLTFTSGANNAYTQNTYTATEWSKMEENGAVFMPAAGYRSGTDVHNVGTDGSYWSSSYNSSNLAYYVNFTGNLVAANYSYDRNCGFSVRVVKDADNLLSELNAKVAKLDKQLNPPVGSVSGKFSVSETKKVYFSQGNLQYQASSGIWRFAEKQYDMIGEDNSNISSTYSGWIDLFGWGTSGYNNKFPYMTSTTNADYGDGANDIAGTNYDWGVYNKISNGGNQAGLWRMLTDSEWDYLKYDRTNANALYGVATVNNVTGLVLLPDEWTLPAGVTFKCGANGDYEQNTYSAEEWAKMEFNGAVFLPAAGYRSGTDVFDVEAESYYWTGSADDGNHANCLYFYYYSVETGIGSGRYNGQSVRLVQDAE
ncbi:MAG: hypothetical protein J6Y55_06110 [Bacteroidales bacterium]|nr:hypothetical protein [Bacteroidales bacterium]